MGSQSPARFCLVVLRVPGPMGRSSRPRLGWISPRRLELHPRKLQWHLQDGGFPLPLGSSSSSAPTWCGFSLPLLTTLSSRTTFMRPKPLTLWTGSITGCRQLRDHIWILRVLALRSLPVWMVRAPVLAQPTVQALQGDPQHVLLHHGRGPVHRLGSDLPPLLRHQPPPLPQRRTGLLEPLEHDNVHPRGVLGSPLPRVPLLFRPPVHPHQGVVQVRALSPPPKHGHRALRRPLHASHRASLLLQLCWTFPACLCNPVRVHVERSPPAYLARCFP